MANDRLPVRAAGTSRPATMSTVGVIRNAIAMQKATREVDLAVQRETLVMKAGEEVAVNNGVAAMVVLVTLRDYAGDDEALLYFAADTASTFHECNKARYRRMFG